MTKLRIISIGEVIHSWTVLQLLPKRYYSCKCKCGNTSEVRAHDLLSGKSKSCRSCQISIAKRGHNQSSGDKRSLEYVSWSHIVQRTTNPKNKDYPEYGARGITMEPAWLESFEAFYMSIGPCPGPGYTVDRIEGSKGYVFGNVRWASKTTQNRNRSSNVLITYNGQQKVLSEWLQDLNVSNPNSFYKRMSRRPNSDPSEMFNEFIEKGAKFK